MALDDDIRILSRVGLFEEFSQEQLRLLAFGAENMGIAAGRELYGEGMPADCAFVISSGEIALVRDRDGKTVTVGAAGPGAILGELALISGTSRMTGAVAVTDSDVIRLSRKLFRRILEEYPDLAAKIHNRIVTDMKALVSRLEGLAPRFGP